MLIRSRYSSGRLTDTSARWQHLGTNTPEYGAPWWCRIWAKTGPSTYLTLWRLPSEQRVRKLEVEAPAS
jgi:hypothetical protein